MGYSLPSSCTAFASPAWSIHLGIYGKPFFTCIIQHQRRLSFTHIKHRTRAVASQLVPAVAPTHLLPLRFEYLFTLCWGVAETYPIWGAPLSRSVRGAASLPQRNHRTYVCTGAHPAEFSYRHKAPFWYSVNFNQILLPMVLRCPRFSRTRARNSNRTK